MLAPGLVPSSPDLVIATNKRSVEGSGVIVTEGVAALSPLRWRLRIDAVDGVRTASEWTRVFHRRDEDRTEYIDLGKLLPHSHKLNLSACGGNLDNLVKITNAIEVERTRHDGTCSARLTLTTSHGLSESGNAAYKLDDSGSWRGFPDYHTQGPKAASCGFAGRTMIGTTSPNSAREVKVPQSLGAGKPSSSISIGLVPEALTCFRGEVFVRLCDLNPAKLRGIGCAWRSDGVLLSQQLASSGIASTWIGRTTPFGVGDEVEVKFIPSLGDIQLFLNGTTVAGFPHSVLGGAPACRLAIRVQRSRVTLLSEDADPLKGSSCRGKLLIEPKTFPQGFALKLQPHVDDFAVACEEVTSSERVRGLIADRGRKPPALHVEPRLDPEEHFPPTLIPGLGRKLVANKLSLDAQAQKALQARFAENRSQRLSAMSATR